MTKTKLIVISAPSGAGKTTLCKKLLNDLPSLVLSISSTSRAPRGNEIHGKDYFFHTREEFEAMIQKEQFAEWALVHGNYYGTWKKVVENAFEKGRSLLLDIDVQGAESLKRCYPSDCVLIFVAPPSLQELEARLRARGTDSEETIERRLTNARAEMSKTSDFHHVITNDDLDRAFAELRGLIESSLAQSSTKVGNSIG